MKLDLHLTIFHRPCRANVHAEIAFTPHDIRCETWKRIAEAAAVSAPADTEPHFTRLVSSVNFISEVKQDRNVFTAFYDQHDSVFVTLDLCGTESDKQDWLSR